MHMIILMEHPLVSDIVEKNTKVYQEFLVEQDLEPDELPNETDKEQQIREELNKLFEECLMCEHLRTEVLGVDTLDSSILAITKEVIALIPSTIGIRVHDDMVNLIVEVPE